MKFCLSTINWQSIAAILTFFAVAAAWFIPFKRDRQRKKEHDKITKRSISFYLDVLLTKIEDKWKLGVKNYIEGSFEHENKQNHDILEKIFLNLDVLDKEKRDKLWEFIKFYKTSFLPKMKYNDLKIYKKKITTVIKIFPKQ